MLGIRPWAPPVQCHCHNDAAPINPPALRDAAGGPAEELRTRVETNTRKWRELARAGH